MYSVHVSLLKEAEEKLKDLTRTREEWKVSGFLMQSRDRLVTSPCATSFFFSTAQTELFDAMLLFNECDI
jgi:hypothetical protein